MIVLFVLFSTEFSNTFLYTFSLHDALPISYSLRRQAIGVLRIIEDKAWDIRVEELLAIVENIYGIEDEKIKNDIHHFFKQRVQYLFVQSGIEQDVVESVTNKKLGSLAYTHNKAVVLSSKRNDDRFKPVQEALVRVLNLNTEQAANEIQKNLFITESEEMLYEKYLQVKNSFQVNNIELKAEESFDDLIKLSEPINDFFDNNMVMADDDQVKGNRLALVEKISNLIKEYADLTVIEWKQQFN